MKKVILTIIIALSVIMSISAHDFSVNGIYYNILSEEDLTCEVTFRGSTCNEYDEYIDHISIPEQVTYNSKKYKVVAIGNKAFWGNNEYGGLTIISIPNTIKTIGSEAFGFTLLKTVTIPESVTSVGECAFYNCSSLTTVYFNAINCPVMGSINYPTFDDCDKLTTVVFGKNVNIIPACGFYRCSGLTSVSIPDSVTTIGSSAFEGCSGIKSIDMGCSVINIGSCAFRYCTNISSITLPNTLKTIGEGAFYNCKKITSITIPESVDSIGYSSTSYGVFSGCSELKTVNFNAINCVGGCLFVDCKAIQSVALGDGVQIIPFNSFKGCTSILSISIPESVTSMVAAFADCSGLKTVNLNAIDCDMNLAFIRCKAIKELNFGEKVKTISEYAFKDCSGIESLSLPKSLTSIGDYAFANCNKLSSVVIPDQVKVIGKYAFDGLTLHSLTIGVGVTSIGYGAFSVPNKTIWLTNVPPASYARANGAVNIVPNDSYSSLTNVSVYPHISSMFDINGIKYVPVSPSERTCDIIDCLYDTTMTEINIAPSVEYKGIEMKLNKINKSAFINNNYIKTADITFGGNIERAAFSGCDSLENVMVNVPSIGLYAFYNCRGLKKVVIGSNVNSIGDNSFSNCASLNDLSVGENVKFVGNNAFSDCSELKEVMLGENVDSIGDFTFLNCTGLERLEFGCNMKYIGNQAFANCTSLVKLRSKAQTPPTCGELALDDINKWNCELMVPDASVSLYQAADQWKDFFYIVPDGIEDVKVDNNAVEVFRYDINGRLLNRPAKGINIVKMSDGTTRKDYVKNE